MTLSIASGRLSYVLGLHGPCFNIDTACSAGIVAANAARGALQLRECAVANVMATNLMLSPYGCYTPFSIAGMTSTDGRCKTFDGRANGYCRSESCGAAVLRSAKGSAAVHKRHALAPARAFCRERRT